MEKWSPHPHPNPTQCNLADILDHMGGTSVPTQSLASHNFSLFGVWIFFIASYIWVCRNQIVI